MRAHTARLLVALSMAAAAAADTLSYCPSDADSVCFAVGIPASTASAGSGNVYFQIAAPSTYQWVALGTGSQMAGANIFVVYQDGAGNLTLSPRLGTGHRMPTHDDSSTAAQLTLLAGSGVAADGTMTANVVCANCESWNSGSGSLSVTSTSAPWIAAWRTGSALDTTDTDATISEHSGTARFALDLTAATVASDSNPFVGSASGSASASASASSSSGTTSAAGSRASSGSGSDSFSGVTVPLGGFATPPMLVAHAVVLCLVMAALYPLGAALMPLLGHWAVHAVWQTVSYALMWAGFALGVVLATQQDQLFRGDARTHTVLGTVVVAALGLQPILGLLHHRHFVAHQRRGLVSHVHIWWGRLFMVLGIVNGGIGLHLASAPRRAIIGYGVAAAVLFLAYLAVKLGRTLFGSRRRARDADPGPRRRRPADVIEGERPGPRPSTSQKHKQRVVRETSRRSSRSSAPPMRETSRSRA